MCLCFPHCSTASTRVGLFTINEDSGVIEVASSIDWEDVGDTVTLTVKVKLCFPLCLTNNVVNKL